MVQRSHNMPLWVYLAFSSIGTRKGALWLISVCIVFTLYCIPWRQVIPGQEWIKKIFLVDDWTWFVMMIPCVVWYWMSFKWIDNNATWEDWL